MKVTYDIAWRVWFIPAFGQWVIHPPDGFYRRSGFVFLANVHAQYFKRQKDAWDLARKLARKDRTLAVLHAKETSKARLCRDYRTLGCYNEEVQATECPKHLYP